MLYLFELLVWLMFGVLFVVCGASLVALVSAKFSPARRLDRFQVAWLLIGLVGSAGIMLFMAVYLAVSFNYIAMIIGILVGAYVWTKFIEDGLELPHSDSELFRS